MAAKWPPAADLSGWWPSTKAEFYGVGGLVDSPIPLRGGEEGVAKAEIGRARCHAEAGASVFASMAEPVRAGDPLGILDRFMTVAQDFDDESLAKVLELPVSAIRDLRRGECPVSADAVTRLCTKCGISPLWMLASIGPREAGKLRDFFAGQAR
jgi:hypothetical protein